MYSEQRSDHPTCDVFSTQAQACRLVPSPSIHDQTPQRWCAESPVIVVYAYVYTCMHMNSGNLVKCRPREVCEHSAEARLLATCSSWMTCCAHVRLLAPKSFANTRTHVCYSMCRVEVLQDYRQSLHLTVHFLLTVNIQRQIRHNTIELIFENVCGGLKRP